jgi:hypothetical protein
MAMFLALCHHFDFLVKVLPKLNKLQVLPFFTHIPNYSQEAATLWFPWNKTVFMPSFMGLPPHVSILAQVEGLKMSLEKAKGSINGRVKVDLDGWQLGSQSYFDKEEIIQKMEEINSKLLWHVEVVSQKLATAVQHDAGPEVMVGGLTSVSSLSGDPSLSASVALNEQGSRKK